MHHSKLHTPHRINYDNDDHASEEQATKFLTKPWSGQLAIHY